MRLKKLAKFLAVDIVVSAFAVVWCRVSGWILTYGYWPASPPAEIERFHHVVCVGIAIFSGLFVLASFVVFCLKEFTEFLD